MFFAISFSAPEIFGQNAPEIIPLELNKPLESKISGSAETQKFQILLKKNQYAKIVIEQTQVDVSAKIFEGQEKLLNISDNVIQIGQPEIVEIVADNSGVYTIEIKTTSLLQKGKYQIHLAELRDATDGEKQIDIGRRKYFEALEFYNAGQNDKALTAAEQSLEIREKVSGVNNIDTAVTLTLLGTINWSKDNLAEAEKFFRRAAEIIEKNYRTNNLKYADAIHGLAKVQHSSGNYSESKKSSKIALSIREKAAGANSLAAAESLFSLGLLYRVTNDIPKAEQFYLRVLEIREKNLGAEHLDVGLILHNLGYLYYTVGDYVNADSFFRRASAIKEKVLGAENPSVGMTLINQGLVEWKRGNYKKAESYWRRALQIFEKSSGPESNWIATCLHNLGIVYKETGDYSKGEEYYLRALAMWEKVLGKDHPRTAIAVSSLAILYRATGDYENAEKFHRRELAIYEKIYGQNHPETALSLDNLARLYAEKGDIPRSVEYEKHVIAIEEKNISLSLSIGSERQKIAFFNTQLQKPDRLISLHARLAPENAEARDLAATVILTRKGRILDALADNLSALAERSNAQDRDLIKRLNDINSKLARLILNGAQNVSVEEYQKQIKNLENQRDWVESEVARRSQGFYKPSKPVTLDSIRAEIPEQSALVEFAVYRPFDTKAVESKNAYGEPRYIAYIIRRRGEILWKDLGDKETVDKSIDDLRNVLRDPKSKNVKQVARAADDKIMKPVRAFLGDAKQIFISPDGDLNLIPFEALVDENGKYLIENYSFDYLTSGRDLLRMKTARSSKSESLIIANPLFSSPDDAKKTSVTAPRNLSNTYFAPLAGTEREAHSIQTLFPAAKILTDAQANEAALKAVNAPRILHIATHGFFLEDTKQTDAKQDSLKRNASAKSETENPLLRSGLAFAGANDQTGERKDDGILTALEASGLNLWGTKLVVLSACDTGIGDVKNGEGVYGLRRAFTLAGTESLVMSLWEVSDFSTRELMAGYYKNLKNGIGRNASLRLVQMEMLNKKGREHPFFWAAFIQSGEWANLDGKR